jgi:hypothetical protein
MQGATVLTLLLAAAACNHESDSSGPDLSPEPRPALVSLTTNAGGYAPSAPGVLRVHNDSPEELTHGVCPSLERQDGDRWVAVDPHAVCIAIAVVLSPGQTYELSFVAPNAGGAYRYVLDFTRTRPEGDPLVGSFRQASNTFTVGP